MSPNSLKSTSYTVFVGIDCADAKLDISVRHASGRSQTVIDTRPASLRDWVLALRQDHPQGAIAVCIEQPCSNLTVFFQRYDFIHLFLINPMILKRYRESFHLARAKDDRKDARMLADLVAERHEQLPVWKPDSAHARELRSLVEHRRSLVDDRTRLVNRLTALLKDYFPQALDLTGKELHARLACDFLLKWPTLQSLQRARKESIAQFYRSHRSGRPKLLAERLEAIANAIAMSDDEALLAASTLKARSFAEQLNLLRNQIERVETRIAELMETHEDAKVFFSLPGAGPVLASRLASTMGTDRARFENAAALQCFTGIAPVTKASGQKHHVHRRFAKCTCPHFEHQSFMEWVGQTIPVSLWASAYYQQQKERGARHQTALRALAYKWQRIVFRCWKNRELYDESTYLRALERAKSPLVNKIRELKLQRGLEAAA